MYCRERLNPYENGFQLGQNQQKYLLPKYRIAKCIFRRCEISVSRLASGKPSTGNRWRAAKKCHSRIISWRLVEWFRGCYSFSSMTVEGPRPDFDELTPRTPIDRACMWKCAVERCRRTHSHWIINNYLCFIQTSLNFVEMFWFLRHNWAVFDTIKWCKLGTPMHARIFFYLNCALLHCMRTHP